MSNETKDPVKEPVVAVCENETRLYGPVAPNGIRPLWRVQQHTTNGAAKQYAIDYEAGAL